MYLLDTDIIIYALKGNPSVKENLQKHMNYALKISVITLMELYYGAHKSQHVTANLAKIKALEDALEIMTVGQDSVEIFGISKAELEKYGTPLDDFDLIIASTALTHNLILVTNNTKHFERIKGLKLENWAII